jgi:hypothetical protein
MPPQKMFAGTLWRFGVGGSSKKYLLKKIVLRRGIGGKLVVRQHLPTASR